MLERMTRLAYLCMSELIGAHGRPTTKHKAMSDTVYGVVVRSYQVPSKVNGSALSPALPPAPTGSTTTYRKTNSI